LIGGAGVAIGEDVRMAADELLVDVVERAEMSKRPCSRAISA
jgi:hypothetical protein